MGHSAVRTRLTAVIAAVVGLGLTVPAMAAAAPSNTLYVDATGVSCSDTDGGAATLPFCTAEAAARAVQAGQTIRITGHAGEMQLEHSGTPDAPIIVEGSGDDDGPGGPGTRDTALWVMDSHDVILRNLHVPANDGRWSVIAAGNSRVTFDHNTFEGDATGGGGLFVPQNDHLIITRNRIDTYKNDHIRSFSGTNDVIAGNVFGGSGGTGVNLDKATGFALTGNTFVGQCGQAITLTGASPGGHVENNLITQLSSSTTAQCPAGPAAAVKVDAAAAPGVTVDYNLVHPDAGVDSYTWGDKNYADAAALAAATGQGSHDLNSDPQLGDGNTLREGSPAIDSANADAPGELGTDIDGAPRVDDPTVPNTGNGIHDRGAHELVDTWTANGFAVSATQAPVGGTVTVNGNLSSGWNLPFTCDIAYGDGNSASVSPCQASHAYAAPGTYTITTKAHNAGGLGHDYTNVVKVVPDNGTLTPSVTATSTGALSAEAKASVGDDPWNIASTTVDFGDGTGAGSATSHRYGQPGTYTITATVTDAAGRKGTASTKFTTDGTGFTPYGPARLLDTRTTAQVPTGGTVRVKIGDNGSIPADAKAVAMNVTVTNPTGSGHVTAYAEGTTRPDTSNVNYVAGQTVPNMTITPVGANGYVDLYNSGASADLIVDVTGYFTATAANAYTAVNPNRLLDTRTAGTPLRAGQTLSLPISGDATAVSLNVTVTNPAAAGFVTAFPSGSAVPTASSLNFTAGQTVANAVIVRVGADGKISFHANADTDLIVDVTGRFSAHGTSAYVPVTPVRQVDTRNGAGPIPGHSTRSFDLTKGIPNLAPQACTAIVLTATATNTSGPGFLTVFSPLSGSTPPDTSSLNWVAGQTVPNLVLAQVQPGSNSVAPENFYVSSTADLIVDVSGYFSA